MTQRIFGLDLLRAIAIFLVLLAHSRDYLPADLNRLIKLFLIDGVDVFFVLSGFLIGQIILKEFSNELNLKSVGHFWLKRWMRTIPNYLLILSIVIFTTYILGINDDGVAYWEYFLFLQNFANPHPIIFPEAWSLSVEEWFYIFLPLLILIFFNFQHRLKNAILISAFLLFSLAIGYRVFQYYELQETLMITWDSVFRKTVLSRIDSLMVGILVAWVMFYYKNVFFSNSIALFIFGVFGIYLIKFTSGADPILLILSPTLTAIFISFSIPYLYNFTTGRMVFEKFIVTTSKISYSLYLVNYTLIKYYFLENLDIKSQSIKFFLFWVLSFMVSIFLFRFFENPILKLRNRILD